MRAPAVNRKLHRIGAIVTALPVLIVVVTGIVLQLKKEVAWVQPPTKRGRTDVPTISFDTILATVRAVPEAEVVDWSDIDRLDVRPAKGVVKVRAKNRWEVQVDAATGEILQTSYRRSDFFESLHDGSFFHEKAKLWIFLPSGIILFGLWVTGVYLWLLPHLVKRRRRRAAA